MFVPYAAILAAIVAVLTQPPNPGSERLEPITDPAAYAVYAAIVPPAWENVRPRGSTLLMQEETEIPRPCDAASSLKGGEWDAVEHSFRESNTRIRRLLQSMLVLDVAYRLIPRAEIKADDARRALKYPGVWQRRPESMDFVAVSAVGFNAERTKAVVYVRGRSSGTVQFLEMLNGKWVRAKRGGCSWIA